MPVIPLALKTDMLRNGKIIRDIGPVCPENDVWFEFGPAMEITGAGYEDYRVVVRNTGGLMVLAPLLVLYCFGQRFLIQGIESSGLAN